MHPFISIAHAIVVLFPLLNLSLADPAPGHDLQSQALGKRAGPPSEAQITAANGMFPGIDWDMTATTGCDSNQFAVLVESTRMALEMMKFTGEDLRVAYDTTGFHRYFMKTDEWFELSDWEFANRMHGEQISRTISC